MFSRIILFFFFVLMMSDGFSWGFFAHKLINRNAVFTLPEAMLVFYKSNLDFLANHAVDPDRRRYSDPDEAVRHFIDLDYYEVKVPVDTLPKQWKNAVLKYSEDTLLAYGIVPWHVNRMVMRLTEAFKELDAYRILKTSAELGHYVADACVPLHSTINYNGQLTGQTGIHSFWESRLPELFSNKYNLLTGKVTYIGNVQQTIWNAVEGSFGALDSVLILEKILSSKFPPDFKFELIKKGRNMEKIYSEDYAKAYHDLLAGQVERRMRLSIQLAGSLWYTAWVDAGQPDVSGLKLKERNSKEKKVSASQKMLGRQE